jgi:hypothetical protein
VIGTAPPVWRVGAVQRHSDVPDVVDHRFQLGLPHRSSRRDVLLLDPGLASASASFITGGVYPVDGGWTSQ